MEARVSEGTCEWKARVSGGPELVREPSPEMITDFCWRSSANLRSLFAALHAVWPMVNESRPV